MNQDCREKEKSELLSAYIDQLNAGVAPSLADFAASHGQIGQEIRDLIEPALPIRDHGLFPPLSKEKKEAAFARLQAKLRGKDSTSQAVPIDKRTDILILMFSVVGQIWGSVKLMKLPLLLAREGGCGSFVPDFYEHVAYNYGAFDKAILSDVDSLVQMGILEKKLPPALASNNAELDAPTARKRVDAIYALTPRGKKIAETLERSAQAKDPKIMQAIRQVIEKYGKKSGDELIDYTYNTYPDTAVNSKVKDQYLRPRQREDGTGGGKNNGA